MRPFGAVVSIADALDIVRATGTPVARRERVTLRDALGRVLAEEGVSPRGGPPFARAARDGYAGRARATAAAASDRPAALRVIDTIYTGQMPASPVGAGECAEIASGAPLPPDADAAVMVEQTGPAADRRVHIFAPARPGQHVGPQGADIRMGQTALARGDVLTAARLGAAAAVGRTDLEVFARPRVAIASTGNEIVEPGRPLGPGQIYAVTRSPPPASG